MTNPKPKSENTQGKAAISPKKVHTKGCKVQNDPNEKMIQPQTTLNS
jgi:hypothetical protein